MPSNETARERVAEAIESKRYPLAGNAVGYWESRRVEADAAIAAHNAWLWEQADDWETVQRYIAGMLEGEVKCDVHPESYHGKLEDMAAEITTTIMTALIGPRPQGVQQ